LTVRVSAQFIPGRAGPLAVVLREPAEAAGRASALYVPPFGDEMNKSRRIVAVQAHALAAQGWSVAAVDLRGTGDSAGEHADATWQGWQEDVRTAWDWLAQRGRPPSMLWGLRLGAWLAVELVGSGFVSPSMLLLWQPVASGQTFFKQLLRAVQARRMTGTVEEGTDSKSPRAALREGESIDVGGYAIHPELVAGAEGATLRDALPPHLKVIVRETSIAPTPVASAGAQRIATAFRQRSASVDLVAVNGPSFWSTQEIVEAPDLVAATTTAVLRYAGSVGASP
jgi:exosortase A-associated hydrolase 2